MDELVKGPKIGRLGHVVCLSSFFAEVHPNGYRDMFVSTLIPFVLGALIYYAVLYYQITVTNRLLKQVQAKAKKIRSSE